MGRVYALVSSDSRIIYGVFSTPSKAMAARTMLVEHFKGSDRHGPVTAKDFDVRPYPLDEAFLQ